MKEELLEKDYRAEFVGESVRNGIAYQIRALRKQRDWSQVELGRQSGKAQNVISRIENPDYGSLTVSTLLDIAAAFDIGLIVRFAPFRDVMARLENVSPEALFVPSFEAELEQERIEQQSKIRYRGNAENNRPFLWDVLNPSRRSMTRASSYAGLTFAHGASAAQTPVGQTRNGGAAAAAA